MQKDATENIACIACGADVRSEALFCYNCGGAVATQTDSEMTQNVETIHAEVDTERNATDAVRTSKPHLSVVTGKAAKPERKPLTAAMLRRKRASNRQPIEIVWEEPSRPSIMFVVASIVLTVLTVLILAIALYLK